MTVRLGIVIPYRDRAQHLAEFIPHIRGYFRSITDQIDARVLVVEQVAGSPFNRGLLKNIGFTELAADTDAVCFHDVDLLPLTANYTPSDHPAMLISEGIPFAPETIRQLFGGVVLIKNEQFFKANGYSNLYPGWGFEDVDLKQRLIQIQCSIEHRVGNFKRLDHPDEGTSRDGNPTTDHVRNRDRYIGLWFRKTAFGHFRKSEPGRSWMEDGLSNLAYSAVQSRHSVDADKSAIVERIVVEPPP